MNNNELIQSAVGGSIFFGLVYYGVSLHMEKYSLPASTHYRICSRLVAIVHASISVLAALLCFRDHGFWWIIGSKDVYYPLSYEIAIDKSELRQYSLLFTASYLFYDLILLVYNRHNEPIEFAIIIHHTLIIVTTSFAILTGFGSVYMAYYLIDELTTPFLHLRTILLLFGYKDRWFFIVNNLVVVALFASVRVAFNLCLLNDALSRYSKDLPVVERMFLAEVVPNKKESYRLLVYILPILAFIHCLINVYWFALILRTAFRSLVRVIIREKPLRIDTKAPLVNRPYYSRIGSTRIARTTSRNELLSPRSTVFLYGQDLKARSRVDSGVRMEKEE